tara:strand:- start:66649 stop:67050 length:402 start_codon:yes stop_codon:yes gene_type:complete
MAYTSLKHAEHNKEVCEHLQIDNKYTDWVITTAFYASLHFMRHKLFPRTLLVKGKSITINTFHEYCDTSGQTSKKHGVLRKLIESECDSSIAAQYNQLMDLSFTARYSNYQKKPRIGNLAQRRMMTIREYAIS